MTIITNIFALFGLFTLACDIAFFGWMLRATRVNDGPVQPTYTKPDETCFRISGQEQELNRWMAQRN